MHIEMGVKFLPDQAHGRSGNAWMPSCLALRLNPVGSFLQQCKPQQVLKHGVLV